MNSYAYVLCPGMQPDSGDILPDADYFLLRRLNGLLLHCLVGMIDDGRKVLYVDLDTGYAELFQKNRELDIWQKIAERFYPVPLKVRETSDIFKMTVKDYFEYFYA